MSGSTLFSIFHKDESDGSSCHASGVAYDYHDLVDLAFESAALFHPGCGRTLLTDEHTKHWNGLPLDVDIRRSPADERLMLARLEAEISFVRDAPPAALLVSMDGDMLVNSSFDDLVDDEPWDLALTYRDEPDWPINGGIALVNGPRRENALTFLEQVRGRYAEDFAEDSSWWGHQRALIETIGRAEFANRRSDLMHVRGVAIRLLPCDTYNFSPDTVNPDIGRPLADKRLLHFKGPRKIWMRPYWNAHLATRVARTPATLASAAFWRWRLRPGSRYQPSP